MIYILKLLFEAQSICLHYVGVGGEGLDENCRVLDEKIGVLVRFKRHGGQVYYDDPNRGSD